MFIFSREEKTPEVEATGIMSSDFEFKSDDTKTILQQMNEKYSGCTFQMGPPYAAVYRLCID